jgi:hypothetical protein
MEYKTHPHQVITDQQFQTLLEDGFLILPSFIPADELPELQRAQRACLKTWEEVKDNPPADRAILVPYPYPDLRLSQLYLHPELIKLGRRFLKTQNVHARVGYTLARYPGFVSRDTGHIDNGNNSLLPMSTDPNHREYGQLGFWIHVDEVKPGQAPLRLVKNKDRGSMDKATELVCPAGTVCIFNNYTWHASSNFTATQGERFVWGWGLGCADHYFEGLISYTSIGQKPMFTQVIASFTADQRTLFRFPPPNHPYYTKQTLEALEKQYPGFNARGEYKPMN